MPRKNSGEDSIQGLGEFRENEESTHENSVVLKDDTFLLWYGIGLPIVDDLFFLIFLVTMNFITKREEQLRILIGLSLEPIKRFISADL